MQVLEWHAISLVDSVIAVQLQRDFGHHVGHPAYLVSVRLVADLTLHCIKDALVDNTVRIGSADDSHGPLRPGDMSMRGPASKPQLE